MCQFTCKMNTFDSFSQSLPKMGFEVATAKPSVWAYNFIANEITKSLSIIFADKKYDVIILRYYSFNFTC